MPHPLVIKNICKSFGSQTVLDKVDLELCQCQIHALVGESGCGKTTLMRIIAGLEQADSGCVFSFEKNITNLCPEKRGIGLVFQDYALFPHLTVAKNIAFGIRKNKTTRIAELLDLIGLPDIADRYPHQLSGGQQQRVAIARALAPKPNLLLMDEPFSNLDPIKRKNLRGKIRNLAKETQTSILIVSHDIDDALRVADTVTILQAGSVVQSARPEELCSNPANDYVADMVG